jgi:hypothetical protein
MATLPPTPPDKLIYLLRPDSGVPVLFYTGSDFSPHSTPHESAEFSGLLQLLMHNQNLVVKLTQVSMRRGTHIFPAPRALYRSTFSHRFTQKEPAPALLCVAAS